MQVDTDTTAPSGVELVNGRVYFDTDYGKLYVRLSGEWKYVQFTSTSTSSTSSSSSSSSTSSTSTSTTSSSTTTTSSSTTSTSTSTTIY